MRSALLIVLGLVIGILGSVFTFSALHQRTPLPKAVMTVMAYHSSVLHHAVKANQCGAAAITTQPKTFLSINSATSTTTTPHVAAALARYRSRATGGQALRARSSHRQPTSSTAKPAAATRSCT